MNESEERWERMERTMEFLLQSDARLSARLDSMGDRLDSMGDRLDTMGNRLDTLSDTVERQQVEIVRIADAVDSLQVETREAIGRMLEIAEGIAAAAVTFSDRTVDHERRIRRLEDRMPSDAA